MGRKHTHYSTEFRAGTVRLVETSGLSIRQAAMDHAGHLRRCIAQSRERPAGTPLAADELAELTEPHRRVRVLEMEHEILRRASAFFAQDAERTR